MQFDHGFFHVDLSPCVADPQHSKVHGEDSTYEIRTTFSHVVVCFVGSAVAIMHRTKEFGEECQWTFQMAITLSGSEMDAGKLYRVVLVCSSGTKARFSNLEKR